MTFFTDYMNLALIAILLVSGGLLFYPALRRGGGLSAAEATQLINRRNAVVVDLRSAAEYGAGHLPSARSIEYAEFASKLDQITKNKGASVLLVCQNGQRSNKAAKVARDAGYSEVHVLQGGMAAWQQAGMPVVKQQVAK